MKSVAIAQIALPHEQVCELEIQEPGIIRHVAIGGEPKVTVGVDGKRQVRELIILFAEIDPDAPKRSRTFMVLQPGAGFEAEKGVDALWCGIGLSHNTGSVAYVYELVRDPALDVETRSRLESPPMPPA